MDRHAEDVSANFRDFGPASRKCAPFLGKPGRKILDSVQQTTNAWFEQPHPGTHEAREAAEHMCGTETFVDLIQAYQDWAGRAFERIMADGLRASNRSWR